MGAVRFEVISSLGSNRTAVACRCFVTCYYTHFRRLVTLLSHYFRIKLLSISVILRNIFLMKGMCALLSLHIFQVLLPHQHKSPFSGTSTVFCSWATDLPAKYTEILYTLSLKFWFLPILIKKRSTFLKLRKYGPRKQQCKFFFSLFRNQQSEY